MSNNKLLKLNAKFHNWKARTLQDSQNDIRAMTFPTPRERIVRVSAFNTLSKVLGLPLHMIPEDIEAVRDLIAKANPMTANIKSSTWTVRISEVFGSLGLLGHHVMSGRCKTACSNDMYTLLDQIPAMPHRLQLTPVTRWLCEQGLEYANFDQAQSERFRADLQARYRNDRFQKVYLAAVNMCNRCRIEFPAIWPQQVIVPHHKRDDYMFPPSDFSQSFKDDVTAMIADSLKPSGRRKRRPIKQSTADQREYTMYRMASAIARYRRISPSTFLKIADIVTPDGLDDALDYIQVRGGQERTGDMYRVARTAHTMAKYWGKASSEDLEKLKASRAYVRPPEGATQKNIDLLLLFKNPQLCEDFLLMPEVVIGRLERKLARGQKLSRPELLSGQIAFASGYLVNCPLRSANAVAVQEGVSVLEFGSGRNRKVRTVIPADEIKNERAMNFLLRSGMVKLYDTYRKLIRPLIKEDHDGFLFTGRKNKHKSAAQFSDQLAALTSRELGVRMTAHQWRHVVGSIFLQCNPGQYEPVRRMLGHKSIETTMRFYAFMLDEDAQDIVDDTFETIRQEGRDRYRRAPRRKAA